MTRNELQEIVNKFNIDKKVNTWKNFLNNNKTMKLREIKKYMPNYPDYYSFFKPAELRYWLENSEKEGFVDERFCPICGKFIEITKDFRKHYRCGCDLHIKEAALYKMEQRNLKKYGVKYLLQSKEIHEKTIKTGNIKGSYIEGAKKGIITKIKIYGKGSNGKKISETKKNWSKEKKLVWYNKTKATKIKRYGNENYNNKEKIKQTNLIKYGVDNPAKNTKIKEKIAKNSIATRIKNHTTSKDLMNSNKIYKDGLTYKENYIKKVYETRKNNGTLNTSHSFEDKWITYLKNKYPKYTILTQYKEQRYPFMCDCYIKELDLFIEFQGSYYHNYRPFTENKKDIEEYNKLINKGGLYANIANIWRYKDPEKRKYAKLNNLNYIECWEKEFKIKELEDSILLYIK